MVTVAGKYTANTGAGWGGFFDDRYNAKGLCVCTHAHVLACGD